MSRERDSQRSKLYAAENSVFEPVHGKVAFGRSGLTVEEAQAFIDKVQSSKWFQKHHGDGFAVEVNSGPGQTRAFSFGGSDGWRA